MSVSSKTLRLDRLLANLGYGSRRDIHALARAGRVALDGLEIADVTGRIALAEDLPRRLTIDNAPLDPLPGMVVMMHKPLGVTCSHRDAGPLVYDLLPPRWRARSPAISSIGRLDKDTSGLLLLTDDGALLHRVISPKAKVAKRYRVELARPLRGDEGNVLASGTLVLDGEEKPLRPAELKLLSEPSAVVPVVAVTIHEGRYHQVRRMFAALGNHVSGLHREAIGGLQLPDDLQAGSYRVLTEPEIAAIFT